MKSWKAGTGNTSQELANIKGAPFQITHCSVEVSLCDFYTTTSLYCKSLAYIPFWELMPPIQEASVEEKLTVAALNLQTSERALAVLGNPSVLCSPVFGC